MATLGLSRRNDFEMANEACASCGVRQRVLRERRIRDTDWSA
jgi:ribosomal protein L37E